MRLRRVLLGTRVRATRGDLASSARRKGDQSLRTPTYPRENDNSANCFTSRTDVLTSFFPAIRVGFVKAFIHYCKWTNVRIFVIKICLTVRIFRSSRPGPFMPYTTNGFRAYRYASLEKDRQSGSTELEGVPLLPSVSPDN